MLARPNYIIRNQGLTLTHQRAILLAVRAHVAAGRVFGEARVAASGPIETGPPFLGGILVTATAIFSPTHLFLRRSERVMRECLWQGSDRCWIE